MKAHFDRIPPQRENRRGIILIITIVCLVLIAGITANVLKNAILQQQQVTQWQDRAQLELLIYALIETAVNNTQLQQADIRRDGIVESFAGKSHLQANYRLETIALAGGEQQIRISAELRNGPDSTHKMTQIITIKSTQGDI